MNTKKKKSKQDSDNNQELFNKFMIEEGYWKVIDGQLTDTQTSYVDQKQLKYNFETWLAKGAKSKSSYREW